MLIARNACVCGELVGQMDLAQSTVSQHLKILKDARLVTDQSVGNRRIYRLHPDGLAELRAELDRFWLSALAAYKTVVEQPEQEVS